MRVVIVFVLAPLASGILVLLVALIGGGSGAIWLLTFATVISYMVSGGLISIIPSSYFIIYPRLKSLRTCTFSI
ncbi:MAG: hypothetical protein ACI8WB_003127 [Phenylobacterium sp.]|jgi:hypothetical protein